MEKNDLGKVKLGDIGKIVTGKTPSTKKAEYFGEEFKFITPRDMFNEKNIHTTERYLTLEGVKSVKSQFITEKSICVSCIGSDMGKVAIVDGEFVTNQQINTITDIDKCRYSIDYIYYNLVQMRDYFHYIAGGTTMPIINKSSFADIEINLPPLETQEKIANILSSLDDKIENNKRTAEKLEEIAQTLFNRWFVEFNFPNENGKPYKDNGGEMVESELGLIPKGWEVVNINDFTTEIKNGSTPSRKVAEYWDEKEIRWLKSGEVRNNVIISTEEYISKKGLDNSSAKILNENTVIMALYGATAGQVGLLKTETTTNQACCAMVCDKVNKSIYLYNFLKYNNQYIKGLAIGAAQQNLSKDTISKLKIIKPKEYILEEVPFDNLYSKIEYCLRETQQLQTLRDTLLPKLMSGEMEV